MVTNRKLIRLEKAIRKVELEVSALIPNAESDDELILGLDRLQDKLAGLVKLYNWHQYRQNWPRT